MKKERQKEFYYAAPWAGTISPNEYESRNRQLEKIGVIDFRFGPRALGDIVEDTESAVYMPKSNLQNLSVEPESDLSLTDAMKKLRQIQVSEATEDSQRYRQMSMAS